MRKQMLRAPGGYVLRGFHTGRALTKADLRGFDPCWNHERSVDHDPKLVPGLAERVSEATGIELVQVMSNAYQAGHRLGDHRDTPNVGWWSRFDGRRLYEPESFGFAVLNLDAPATMRLRKLKEDVASPSWIAGGGNEPPYHFTEEQVSVRLRPGDLIVQTGECALWWTHGMHVRYRRRSIVFRGFTERGPLAEPPRFEGLAKVIEAGPLVTYDDLKKVARFTITS